MDLICVPLTFSFSSQHKKRPVYPQVLWLYYIEQFWKALYLELRALRIELKEIVGRFPNGFNKKKDWCTIWSAPGMCNSRRLARDSWPNIAFIQHVLVCHLGKFLVLIRYVKIRAMKLIMGHIFLQLFPESFILATYFVIGCFYNDDAKVS